jgi:hypothetical protein
MSCNTGQRTLPPEERRHEARSTPPPSARAAAVSFVNRLRIVNTRQLRSLALEARSRRSRGPEWFVGNPYLLRIA